MFNWIKSVVAAGKRLAASINELSETISAINAQARHAAGLKDEGPLALPAARRKRAEAAANGKGE